MTLEISQRAVDADRARLESRREGAEAAQVGIKISERDRRLPAGSGSFRWHRDRDETFIRVLLLGLPAVRVWSSPCVRVEKTSRLRLVVPVPEKYVGWYRRKERLFQFSVPAFPESNVHWKSRANRTFGGRKNANDARRARCNECGRTLGFGHVSGGTLGCPPSGPTLFVPTSAVCTNDRGNLRRSHPGRKHGMGQRPDG